MGGSVLEKLPLPKFSGNPLDYAEFKALFTELVGSVRTKEVAIMEYLHRSLDKKLRYIIRGAKDWGKPGSGWMSTSLTGQGAYDLS